MYKNIDSSNDISKLLERTNLQIEHERKKKRKLLDFNLNGDISDKEYLEMNAECNETISKLENDVAELEKQRASKEDFKRHIDEMRRVLIAAKKDAANGIITREFVNKYIDKILITPLGDKMKLDIKILKVNNFCTVFVFQKDFTDLKPDKRIKSGVKFCVFYHKIKSCMLFKSISHIRSCFRAGNQRWYNLYIRKTGKPRSQNACRQ